MSPRKTYDTPPHGLAELEARYGKLVLEKDPDAPGYRIVSPIGWETLNMVRLVSPLLPKGKLYVHRDMKGPLLRALEAAAKQCPEYVIRDIGCWNPRYKKTKRSDVSVHAYGLAVDINKDTNPLADVLITDMPPLFVDAFVREGFEWGGSWKHTKDAMHLQWTTGF